MFAFNKTVIGKMHILKEIPCEDNSASFSEENGRYHIAIVADGHGSSECYRSKFGSKAATSIALETLKKFAETILESPEIEELFYHDVFSNLRYRSMTMRRLTDTIISEWHDCVEEDYKNNPPTEEELQKAEASDKSEPNISHVYGTTLIAALWLPKCLIIVHQGDGRCDVFYDDGIVDQPVPWDKRCVGTAVTSMCDEDALTSIRNCVLDTTEKQIIACYIGSDGVEDAYRDTYEAVDGKMHSLMGGVHTFYKDLSCQITAMSAEEFDAYLTTMLPEFSEYGRFSRTGSGDDVSVAGIVNLEAMQKHIEVFKQDVKVYDLEEQLFWKEDELRGKMRKHGILRKRMDEAQTELGFAKIEIANIEKQQRLVLTNKDSLEVGIEEAKLKITEFEKDCEAVEQDFKERKIERFLRILSWTEIIARREMQYRREALQTHYEKLLEKQKENAERIDELCLSYEEATKKLQQAEEKFTDAKSKFEEYDAKYQYIDSERKLLEEEIESVLKFKDEEKSLTTDLIN